ncbi:sigma-54 interaction domain-containing protein [Aneurinibacillus tyrosinisolvens]|uniref:sigma-54 interaction domain-containing protein n=1 Tax=Aneurinibacillus tyrosinisolvens TaxID=1443435 RepID=UPI00063F6B4D|nr:sigma-54-dependent Fis family transcriptional regulator [Aneurinibacillus tyrosinisolvens]
MELEDNLLSILESLHDAVLVISKDSKIMYVNGAYSRHFGVPQNKIIGRQLKDVEAEARILQVVQSGRPLINDYSYVHSLGKDICANITPLLENGSLIGAVAIMKDISEVVALQAELERYKTYSDKLEQQLNQEIFAPLKSRSNRMRIAVELARKVAETDASVLLYGETGVGKEVMAKAIHQAGKRANKPFIPINMASIPEALFESELFGYEEGSFTGSKKGGKQGLFELANEGTLFLDEIGEMPLNLQAKILRALQEKGFQRIGGTKWCSLDVRIICATHRDLRQLIKQGSFREDLYYRLNVVPIHIPPLRERRDDIPFLTSQVLANLNPKYQKYVTVLEEVYDIFANYHWPGNVRELSNVLEHMIAICTKNSLTAEDVPHYIRIKKETEDKPDVFQQEVTPNHVNLSLNGLKQKVEKELIEEVIRNSKNRTEAIRKLGMSRKSFYSKLQKYGLA